MTMNDEIYLVDSCTTGTVVRDARYFQTLRKYEGSITTIIGDDSTIDPDPTRTLLSFKDISANGFHVETNDDDGEEHLVIKKMHGYQNTIVESYPSIRESMYYTYVKPLKEFAVLKIICRNQEKYRIWHD